MEKPRVTDLDRRVPNHPFRGKLKAGSPQTNTSMALKRHLSRCRPSTKLLNPAPGASVALAKRSPEFRQYSVVYIRITKGTRADFYVTGVTHTRDNAMSIEPGPNGHVCALLSTSCVRVLAFGPVACDLLRRLYLGLLGMLIPL